MDENSRMKTLSNDLTRRLLNTSESLGDDERIDVINKYSQKLVNSGYRVEQIRKVIINGIKGYERRLRESMRPGGRRLHRTAKESSGRRMRKKILDKTEWFRKKKTTTEQEKGCESNSKGQIPTTSHRKKHDKIVDKLTNDKKIPQDSIKTRSVIFVEQTRDGILAREIRNVLSRLENMLGFRIKVVERTGTTLKNTLSNTNPWAGSHCGRTECVTCNQGGEENAPCTSRSLVYENIVEQAGEHAGL